LSRVASDTLCMNVQSREPATKSVHWPVPLPSSFHHKLIPRAMLAVAPVFAS
jgi:hypothetical protein